MQNTEQPLVASNNDADGSKRTNDLETPLEDLRSKNSFLESELEKVLDDLDRYQAKYESAEDEIEDLIFAKKRLKMKLDSVGMKRPEFEAMKTDLDEARSKMTEQQRRLDDQEQQLEEQDFLIRSLEDDHDKKEEIKDERQERINQGRMSYHHSKDSRRDMTIALLEAKLENLQANESGALNEDMEDAMEKIEKIEAENEELQVEVMVLKESLKEAVDSSLNVDTPQALLLQSVITKKNDEKKAISWGLGGVLADEFDSIFHRGTKPKTSNRPPEKQHSGMSELSILPSSDDNSEDNSDFMAIKEINQKLKEANTKLQKEIASMKTDHNKEATFNQKFIVKLQKENDQFRKKLRPSGSPTRSPTRQTKNASKAEMMGLSLKLFSPARRSDSSN